MSRATGRGCQALSSVSQRDRDTHAGTPLFPHSHYDAKGPALTLGGEAFGRGSFRSLQNFSRVRPGRGGPSLLRSSQNRTLLPDKDEGI